MHPPSNLSHRYPTKVPTTAGINAPNNTPGKNSFDRRCCLKRSIPTASTYSASLKAATAVSGWPRSMPTIGQRQVPWRAANP